MSRSGLNHGTNSELLSSFCSIWLIHVIKASINISKYLFFFFFLQLLLVTHFVSLCNLSLWQLQSLPLLCIVLRGGWLRRRVGGREG